MMTDLPWWTPGVWDVPGIIETMAECPKDGVKCVSFMAEIRAPCLRVDVAKVIHDGREIPVTITVNGDVWTLETTELFSGCFVFHVESVNTCPKVSSSER